MPKSWTLHGLSRGIRSAFPITRTRNRCFRDGEDFDLQNISRDVSKSLKLDFIEVEDFSGDCWVVCHLGCGSRS